MIILVAIVLISIIIVFSIAVFMLNRMLDSLDSWTQAEIDRLDTEADLHIRRLELRIEQLEEEMAQVRDSAYLK
jgi:hypothetical protein